MSTNTRHKLPGEPRLYRCWESYVISYRSDRGKQGYLHVHGGLAAARRARDELAALENRGIRVHKSNLILVELIDEWREQSSDRVLAEDLKQETYEDYSRLVAYWIEPQLAAHRVQDMLPYLIAAFEEQLADDGLKPSSRKQVRGQLRRILQLAVDRGELHFNPVREYERQRMQPPPNAPR